MAASAYLVLASQRSGSTLLAAEAVEDESILHLLDPLDEGKPDLAPPEIWRDYIRTVGRTPNGIWGGN
jgi:trehalose 2-sulfotransferase